MQFSTIIFALFATSVVAVPFHDPIDAKIQRRYPVAATGSYPAPTGTGTAGPPIPTGTFPTGPVPTGPVPTGGPGGPGNATYWKRAELKGRSVDLE
jgi:hypothetical protein